MGPDRYGYVLKTISLEVLNPQPVASKVLLRLLEFIEHVDVCSQRGDPRPDFVAEDGARVVKDIWISLLV